MFPSNGTSSPACNRTGERVAAMVCVEKFSQNFEEIGNDL